MRVRHIPLLVPTDHLNSEFLEGAKPTPQKKPSRRSAAARYATAVREAQIAIDSVTDGTLDFSSLTPRAVVGLFIVLHTRVYGVEPAELLDGREMDGATSAAKRLVTVEFSGRIDWALDFVRWTWRKEAKQFPTRKSDWRIGWRWQFAGRSGVTDYRIAMSKTSAL